VGKPAGGMGVDGGFGGGRTFSDFGILGAASSVMVFSFGFAGDCPQGGSCKNQAKTRIPPRRWLLGRILSHPSQGIVRGILACLNRPADGRAI